MSFAASPGTVTLSWWRGLRVPGARLRMVHLQWKEIKEEGLPSSVEARGPRLEPGVNGGLDGERLVAGFAP